MLDIERPAVALSRQSPRTSTIHFGIMETSTGAGPDRPLPMGWNTVDMSRPGLLAWYPGPFSDDAIIDEAPLT